MHQPFSSETPGSCSPLWMEVSSSLWWNGDSLLFSTQLKSHSSAPFYPDFLMLLVSTACLIYFPIVLVTQFFLLAEDPPHSVRACALWGQGLVPASRLAPEGSASHDPVKTDCFHQQLTLNPFLLFPFQFLLSSSSLHGVIDTVGGHLAWWIYILRYERRAAEHVEYMDSSTHRSNVSPETIFFYSCCIITKFREKILHKNVSVMSCLYALLHFLPWGVLLTQNGNSSFGKVFNAFLEHAGCLCRSVMTRSLCSSPLLGPGAFSSSLWARYSPESRAYVKILRHLCHKLDILKTKTQGLWKKIQDLNLVGATYNEGRDTSTLGPDHSG